MKASRFAVLVAFACVVGTPFALAQPGSKPGGKPGAKPAGSASASASGGSFSEGWDTPKPKPPPPAATTPATDAAPATASTETPTPAATTTAATVDPSVFEASDVTEKPGKTYLFVGARYRGNVVPKFMVNIFVNEGDTFYSNNVGIELDYRKDNFSIIPSLSLTTYGASDTLFLEKNKDASVAGNYTYVNSSLKGVFGSIDLLWSTKIAKNFDFEYGLGIGVGYIVGDLKNDWVYEDPGGKFTATNGKHYTPCPAVDPTRPGCNSRDHNNSPVNKVGGYNEKTWFDGGSVPNIFPWISLPQLGLRFKPLKQLEGRLGIGFALTGFWFGLSANYGLERPDKPTTASRPYRAYQ